MNLSTLVALGCVCAPALAFAHDDHGADDGFDLDFRYRFENVDDANFGPEANASTLRTRLTFDTDDLLGFRFVAEIDNVLELFGTDEFNAGGGTTPNRTQYPVIADVEGTELNQFFIDIDAIDNTVLRVGRQRINRGNQRFVGGVAWRQQEQTFDAASATIDLKPLEIYAAYLKEARRIFSEDVPAGRHDLEGSLLLDATVPLDTWGKLSGYHYRIDNADVAAFSTTTSGVRFTSKHKFASSGSDRSSREAPVLGFSAEYAQQSDAKNNPIDFDAEYYRFDLSLSAAGNEIAIGRESLGGDADVAGAAFRTPLATLHAFNGWADRFLVTPDAGLIDDFVRFKTERAEWLFEARYHRFSAQDGSQDFGDELNVRIGQDLGGDSRLDLFFADFKGDNGFADTKKFWVMLTFDV